MNYKTILVNLNDEKRVDQLLEVATQLARKHTAHLIGLFVTPAVNIVPMTPYLDIPDEVIELHDKEFERISTAIKNKFEAATSGTPVTAEWRAVDAQAMDIGDDVVASAQLADLVIVGQGEFGGASDHNTELAERLIMEAGRPILIVPDKGAIGTVGQYVLVAWNGTQQAARAAFDALPLLERASTVTLFWVDPATNIVDDDQMAGVEMAATLARHNAIVETATAQSHGESVGQTLINKIRNDGSDLLVMGGYGHSRFQEHIFGGVTREILKDMPIPVLMSH